MEWEGMKWDRMGWDGMEWDGMGARHFHLCVQSENSAKGLA